MNDHCQLICDNINSEKLLNEIKKSLNDQCNDYELTIKNIHFASNTIPSNWLGNEYLAKIIKFTIIDHNAITKIDSTAFNVEFFRKVISISFESLAIEELSKNIFKNIQFLRQITFVKMNFKRFELNVFEINSHLNEMNLIKCKINNVKSNGINPSFKLRFLKYLTFVQCDFTNTIHSSFFDGLPTLIKLNLTNNRINELSETVFNAFLQTNYPLIIDLRENELIQLSSTIFARLFYVNKLNRIYLEGNPWHCGAHIISLRNLIKKRLKYFDQPICYTPDRFYKVKISDVVLSGDEPSTIRTTKPSIYPSTKTPKPILSEKIKMICTKIDANLLPSYRNVFVLKPKQFLRVRTVTNGKNKIIVKQFGKDILLLWTKNEILTKKIPANGKFGCFINWRTIATDNVEIDFDVRKDYFYSICIMPRYEKTTAPMNCISFNIEQLLFDVNNVWISMKFQHLFIIVIFLMAIVVVLCGIFMSILLIHQFPKLRKILIDEDLNKNNNNDNSSKSKPFHIQPNILPPVPPRKNCCTTTDSVLYEEIK